VRERDPVGADDGGGGERAERAMEGAAGEHGGSDTHDEVLLGTRSHGVCSPEAESSRDVPGLPQPHRNARRGGGVQREPIPRLSVTRRGRS